MSISSYIENISKRFSLGNATEHTFRGDLQQMLESLVPDIAATNEPKRIDCGAPDYVVTRNDIPVGYIEAKDIGVDLGGTVIKEQRERYVEALDNLIFTDYLEFRFFLDGTATERIRIGEVRGNKIVGFPDEFERFESLIKEFCFRTPQSIKSSKRLAEMMADKAKLLAYVIKNALDSDEETQENSTLKEQLYAFRQVLIHDIDSKQFSDVYAQTIAYGMFAARIHDSDLETFTRQEAAERIPKTNPFLRKLFQYIAGYDLDDRIRWIVDSLADVFRAADVAAILKNFGKSTQTHDPIIHFYETFLAEYDPKLRKSRGVYYTPEPVVDFIVRAVDDILKTEFGLPAGLADTSKVKVKEKTPVVKKGKGTVYEEVEKEYHKVQILDPATGTGTFLAQVIKQIYKSFENQKGIWPQYVEEHLIPRLNGFELLMASYAMAHLKLDLLLTELSATGTQASPPASVPLRDADRLGASPAGVSSDTVSPEEPAMQARTPAVQSDRSQRFRIYLTNSLEEYHPETGTLWASWLSTEANEANHIKRDTPVMVVIGNPPYSGESSNKGDWIMSLMEDYKREPGGLEKLKERNPKWINADEIKFLRYGQHFVARNGEGILAYINAHGFLDHPTLRGMRWNLLKTYDKIYILDLHGNSKKKEVSPDGLPDVNVFDIQQGVSINIFVKTGKKKKDELAQVSHFDVYGGRESKYNFLLNSSLYSVPFVTLENLAPEYFFVQKDFGLNKEYKAGFPVVELFLMYTMAVVTANDPIFVDENRDNLKSKVASFCEIDPDEKKIERIAYRPFDDRFIYFDTKLIERSRHRVMRNFIGLENCGLVFRRQQPEARDLYVFCSDMIIADGLIRSDNKGGESVAPLYLYPEHDFQQTLDAKPARTPNLDMAIVGKIAEKIGLKFVAEKETSLKGTNEIAQGKAEGRHPGNDANTATDPEGVEQTATDVAPLQGANANADISPGFHPGLSSSSPSATGTFAPIDILDYIYGVLHSPSYREKYKEFLKIDFPRVPYPKDAETFWQLVSLGGELRQIHLLESPRVEEFITGYPVSGDNRVEKPVYRNPVATAPGSDLEVATAPGSDPEVATAPGSDLEVATAPGPDLEVATAPGSDLDPTGNVYINDTQYFSGVPEAAWNFYIGGYQPAQKWLKDRKGRTLSYDDIRHYQKIIVALTETDRIMKEIDKIDFIDPA